MSAAKKVLPKYQPARRLAEEAEPSLDLALAEMEAGGDRALALEHLVGVWRVGRYPDVADVIDLLSEELTAKEPPIRAVGSTSGRQMWNRVASEGKPETLNRLLETLPDDQERFYRLRTLIEDADVDPRFGTFARHWFERPPVRGTKRAPYFLNVIELLQKTNDIRILELLQGMTETARRSGTIANVGLRAWKPLQELVKHLEGVKVQRLSAADEATLEKIKKKIVAKGSSSAGGKSKNAEDDPAPFFAKVYADPSDLEARAVLGDLLQQRGDPRGELIALQLARAESGGRRTSRETALIDQWGRDWLGPLERYLQQGGVVFERGFLTECRYSGGGHDVVADFDEWATVTTIDCSYASGYVGGSAGLLASPKLKSLRHVVGIARNDVAHLTKRSQTVLWETLGLRLHAFADARILIGPEAKKSFPNVKKLVFITAWAETFDDLQMADLLAIMKNWSKTLCSLEIALAPGLLIELATTPPAKELDELVVHVGKRATMEIHPKEARVRAVLDQLRAEAVAEVARIIRSLGDAKLIKAVHLDVEGRPKLEKDKITRGRYESADIKPVRQAAKDVGLELKLL